MFLSLETILPRLFFLSVLLALLATPSLSQVGYTTVNLPLDPQGFVGREQINDRGEVLYDSVVDVGIDSDGIYEDYSVNVYLAKPPYLSSTLVYATTTQVYRGGIKYPPPQYENPSFCEYIGDSGLYEVDTTVYQEQVDGSILSHGIGINADRGDAIAFNSHDQLVSTVTTVVNNSDGTNTWTIQCAFTDVDAQTLTPVDTVTVTSQYPPNENFTLAINDAGSIVFYGALYTPTGNGTYTKANLVVDEGSFMGDARMDQAGDVLFTNVHPYTPYLGDFVDLYLLPAGRSTPVNIGSGYQTTTAESYPGCSGGLAINNENQLVFGNVLYSCDTSWNLLASYPLPSNFSSTAVTAAYLNDEGDVFYNVVLPPNSYGYYTDGDYSWCLFLYPYGSTDFYNADNARSADAPFSGGWVPPFGLNQNRQALASYALATPADLDAAGPGRAKGPKPAGDTWDFYWGAPVTVYLKENKGIINDELVGLDEDNYLVMGNDIEFDENGAVSSDGSIFMGDVDHIVTATNSPYHYIEVTRNSAGKVVGGGTCQMPRGGATIYSSGVWIFSSDPPSSSDIVGLNGFFCFFGVPSVDGTNSVKDTKTALTNAATACFVPAHILYALAMQESTWRQFGIGTGSTNISYDGGIGLTQQTGLTALYSANPENPKTSSVPDNAFDHLFRLASDTSYNAKAGATVLSSYFDADAIPDIGLGDRNTLCDWYYALWRYNGFSTQNSPVYGKEPCYEDRVLNRVYGPPSLSYWSWTKGQEIGVPDPLDLSLDQGQIANYVNPNKAPKKGRPLFDLPYTPCPIVIDPDFTGTALTVQQPSFTVVGKATGTHHIEGGKSYIDVLVTVVNGSTTGSNAGVCDAPSFQLADDGTTATDSRRRTVKGTLEATVPASVDGMSYIVKKGTEVKLTLRFEMPWEGKPFTSKLKLKLHWAYQDSQEFDQDVNVN